MSAFESKPLPSKTTPSKWSSRLAALLFLAVASYLYLRTQVYTAPRLVNVAALHLQRLDGSEFDSRQLEGRAVVLNFWAPWCPPCRLEMPWLEDLTKKHPELTVIGVEDDAQEYGNAVAFAQHSAISFPLVRNSESVRGVFGKVLGLPTTLYISPSGKVVHTVTGVVPEVVMRRFAADAAGSR